MPTNRITASGRRVLEDDKFFYVPVDTVPHNGEDLSDYLYIPPGTAGLGEMGGFFSKIKKSVKKIGGKAISAFKKYTPAGILMTKGMPLLGGLVGGMTGQGVPQEAAQGMAQDIAAQNPNMTAAEVQQAALAAAERYRAGGGQMSTIAKVGIGAGVAVAVIGLLGIVYLAARKKS
jgi:hypothetical protein